MLAEELVLNVNKNCRVMSIRAAAFEAVSCGAGLKVLDHVREELGQSLEVCRSYPRAQGGGSGVGAEAPPPPVVGCGGMW